MAVREFIDICAILGGRPVLAAAALSAISGPSCVTVTRPSVNRRSSVAVREFIDICAIIVEAGARRLLSRRFRGRRVTVTRPSVNRRSLDCPVNRR